jgi:hypothetical protein
VNVDRGRRGLDCGTTLEAVLKLRGGEVWCNKCPRTYKPAPREEVMHKRGMTARLHGVWARSSLTQPVSQSSIPGLALRHVWAAIRGATGSKLGAQLRPECVGSPEWRHSIFDCF